MASAKIEVDIDNVVLGSLMGDNGLPTGRARNEGARRNGGLLSRLWNRWLSIAWRMRKDLSSSRRVVGKDSPEEFETKAYLPASYSRLRRIILTDGVGRTLFEEYAAHRSGDRGEEETGWLLLGVREEEQAIILATLPAGALRDAGVGHVLFNSMAQVVGSRIIRQYDKRLSILGLVHTHPGSLRHPSDGDYRGDSNWVGQLRGQEGIFGIGTADAPPGQGRQVAFQLKPNVHCWDTLRFTWYSLGKNDRGYQPLPVEYTLGPDLARSWHEVWPILEKHADRLERLCRQQIGVAFEVAADEFGSAVRLKIPIARPQSAIHVLMGSKVAQFYVVRHGEAFQADPGETRIDRAVYLLLAELAAHDP